MAPTRVQKRSKPKFSRGKVDLSKLTPMDIDNPATPVRVPKSRQKGTHELIASQGGWHLVKTPGRGIQVVNTLPKEVKDQNARMTQLHPKEHVALLTQLKKEDGDEFLANITSFGGSNVYRHNRKTYEIGYKGVDDLLYCSKTEINRILGEQRVKTMERKQGKLASPLPGKQGKFASPLPSDPDGESGGENLWSSGASISGDDSSISSISDGLNGDNMTVRGWSKERERIEDTIESTDSDESVDQKPRNRSKKSGRHENPDHTFKAPFSAIAKDSSIKKPSLCLIRDQRGMYAYMDPRYINGHVEMAYDEGDKDLCKFHPNLHSSVLKILAANTPLGEGELKVVGAASRSNGGSVPYLTVLFKVTDKKKSKNLRELIPAAQKAKEDGQDYVIRMSITEFKKVVVNVPQKVYDILKCTKAGREWLSYDEGRKTPRSKSAYTERTPEDKALQAKLWELTMENSALQEEIKRLTPSPRSYRSRSARKSPGF